MAMMEKSKQTVDHVDSSQVVQTGNHSSVVIQNGMKPAEVIEMCEILIQNEIKRYTQQAEETAVKRYQELSSKLGDALKSLDEVKLEKIKEPAIQIAANETYTEFIRSGEEFLGDKLIDLMIERMSVPEHTAKQIIIDEARRILPKLTKDLVDFLAIRTFLDLSLTRPRVWFTRLLEKVGDLGRNAYKVRAMDIGLLKQTGCATNLYIASSQSVEQILLENYDAFFKKPVPKQQVLDLLKPYFNEAPKPDPTQKSSLNILLEIIGYIGDDWYFKMCRNQLYDPYIRAMKKPEYANVLFEFNKKAIGMTMVEVKSFLINLNKNWEGILYLFNREYVRSIHITPVGYYIGLRHLCKQIGEEIPYSIFFPEK